MDFQLENGQTTSIRSDPMAAEYRVSDETVPAMLGWL